eukprot:3081801-Amphidinium_carterae.1
MSHSVHLTSSSSFPVHHPDLNKVPLPFLTKLRPRSHRPSRVGAETLTGLNQYFYHLNTVFKVVSVMEVLQLTQYGNSQTVLLLFSTHLVLAQ